MDNNITSRAMLVSLSITGIPGMEVEDKQVGREIAHDHQVSETVGRYMKKLLDPKRISELRDVNAGVGALRQYFYANTLPWSERGWGAITATHYFTFTKSINDLSDSLRVAFDKLMVRFPELKEQAKRELNGLWREDDWPEVETLQRRFRVRVKVRPLVDAESVKIMLGVPEEIERIKTEVQQDLYTNLTGTLLDLFRRLKTFLAGDDNERGLIRKLAEYEVDAHGKTGKTFRDSAILAGRELCEIADKLNVMGDQTLSAMNAEIRELVSLDPQSLRDDCVLRQQAVDKAQAVAKKLATVETMLSGYMEKAA